MKNSLTGNRITTIDVAKGIGIIFVVYSHIANSGAFYNIVYSFHMPLFFMLSGMMLNTSKFKTLSELLKKRFKTLICPYFFFCAVGILYNSIYRLIFDRAGFLDFLFKSISSVFLAQGGKYRHFGLFNTPLWFVPSLLLMQVMFYLLDKYIKNRYIFHTLTIVIIPFFGWFTETPFAVKYFDISFLPFNFSSSCFAMIFFTVGNIVYKKYKDKIFNIELNSKNITILILLIIVLGAVTAFVGIKNGDVSIGGRVLNNGLLFVISGFSGSAMIICIASLFKHSRILKYCGENSFTIMGIHIIIYQFCITSFDVILKYTSFNITKYTLILDKSFSGEIITTIFISFLSVIFTIVYNFVRAKIKNNNKSKPPVLQGQH